MDASTSSQLVIPVSWVLGVVGILGTVIATLAGIIYRSLTDRLAVQDRIIEKLQDDVDRLAKGCGHDACHWRAGRPI
jgi:hypothetical protein